MAWAKAQSLAGVKFHLGLSGLSPPPPELLALDVATQDLHQRGRHMPPSLARRMAERLQVAESEMALTLGTSHAMYLLCATQLAPGDLVLVERPAYEMLATLPTLFGARVERFDRTFERRWRWPGELADIIRKREPAMVLISNPHNPTGVFLGAEELEPLVQATQDVGGLLAVDEVYGEFFAEPARHSAFSRWPNVAIASSFTKAYGLGTARLGWLCAAPSVVAAALAHNDYISVLYPNPCAWVGLAALAAVNSLKDRATRIREANLPIVQTWVQSRADVRWVLPDAGVVGFVELPMADTGPFVDRLLAEHDTLVVPGAFFEAPRFVRLGFGADRAVLEHGLACLGHALDDAAGR